MQIPVLSGVYTDSNADFRTALPVNMRPVPSKHGISGGYLRPADGIVEFASGPGADRGGINWDGVMYRVMGTKLVSISSAGVVTTLGDVGAGGVVSFDYSADRLAVVSNGNLFYWNSTSLFVQVTDPDLGTALDVLHTGGYFLTTDGQFIVTAELTNPTQINPLKYGSSEADPDPIKALRLLRSEVYAVNRYTIEVFENVGGDLFPFQRLEGAQIQKGAVGTHAVCKFDDALAFVGGGRNEAPGVYVGVNASTSKISSREVDQILESYTEAQLAEIVLETRVSKNQNDIYLHLPDRTLVFDKITSLAFEELVWFEVNSAVLGSSQYRARGLVYCYGLFLSGDPTTSKVGKFVDNVSSHFGAVVRWEFGTLVIYNEGFGAIVHELELVCLTGRVAAGITPRIGTSYSADGMTWSQNKTISAGAQGDRLKRLVWMQQGAMRSWRVQRFQGDSQAHISVARLEARLEALNV